MDDDEVMLAKRLLCVTENLVREVKNGGGALAKPTCAGGAATHFAEYVLVCIHDGRWGPQKREDILAAAKAVAPLARYCIKQLVVPGASSLQQTTEWILRDYVSDGDVRKLIQAYRL